LPCTEIKRAADVSGLISDVFVHDNEKVSKGLQLFRIDQHRQPVDHPRYDAVERAEFEAGGRRSAEFAHQLLEPLAIGASRAKDEDRRA
jgi:multidrug resistance efflux pump